MKSLLEICSPSLETAEIAAQCGADRIEFCKDLSNGGVTPFSYAIDAIKKRLSIPVHVLIRCRIGNFVFNNNEIQQMIDEIKYCSQHGIDGVVIGALTPENKIDIDAIKLMIDAAGKMEYTFHKAFDETKNQTAALQQLIDLKFTRVLTSGGENTALEGIEQLSILNRIAKNDITIMPGGNIRSNNIVQIARETGCTAFHSAASVIHGMGVLKDEIKAMKMLLNN
ncbi:MAG: hypothetical protein RJA07_516 [Bacteroidota bacterium]